MAHRKAEGSRLALVALPGASMRGSVSAMPTPSPLDRDRAGIDRHRQSQNGLPFSASCATVVWMVLQFVSPAPLCRCAR